MARRVHFTRTPMDLPLLCFALLTVLSSLFSVEPEISLPKLKALVLFGVIYLPVTNLNLRGAKVLTGVLIVSSLFGAGFSLMEKLYGRGMVITEIEENSPLLQSNLLPGDVIWMIARQRIFSPEDAAEVIRRHQLGKTLDVEALHAGDPVPVTLIVTDELKRRAKSFGNFRRRAQSPISRFRLFAAVSDLRRTNADSGASGLWRNPGCRAALGKAGHGKMVDCLGCAVCAVCRKFGDDGITGCDCRLCLRVVGDFAQRGPPRGDDCRHCCPDIGWTGRLCDYFSSPANHRQFQ